MSDPNVTPGGHPAIQGFLKAMGLNPTMVGDFDFTVRAPVGSLATAKITGTFNIFLSPESFAELEGLAPEVRHAAALRLTTYADGVVKVMEVKP